MQPVPPNPAALRRRRRRVAHLAAVTLAASAVMGGCHDPKIRSYTIPKEPAVSLPDATALPPSGSAAPAEAPPAATPPSGPSAPAALQTASGRALSWTAPAEWRTAANGMMRKATYSLPAPTGVSLELAITAFPGDVGGEVANVNRWRGQVGLAELGNADARAAVQRLEANGLKIGIVDVADAAGATRLLGAMVPYDGATWFFKITGPGAAVAAQKPAFLRFLTTLRASDAATP